MDAYLRTVDAVEKIALPIFEEGYHASAHVLKASGETAAAARAARMATNIKVAGAIAGATAGTVEFGVGVATNNSKMKLDGSIAVGVAIGAAIIGGPLGIAIGLGYFLHKMAP
jgi:hypothetical protein